MSSDATSSRRQLLASGLGLAGAAAVGRLLGGGTSFVDAAVPELTGPAAAESAARRLGEPRARREIYELTVPPEGRFAFPLDPGDESVRCAIADNFGDCRSGGSRPHAGVDIASDLGQRVFALSDGVLRQQYVDSGRNYGAGNGWTLEGDDGYVYRYFHLDAFADGLEEGDEVVFGQVIGTVGDTGTSPTNYHLHFEISQLIDPDEFWERCWIDPFPVLEIPDGVTVWQNDEMKDCAHLWNSHPDYSTCDVALPPGATTTTTTA